MTPPDSPRAVVVGEALVDVLGTERVPGGSPLNVAVGLARLGVPTALLTQLGADEDGDRVRTHADASGVEVRAVAAPRTSSATVTVGADGSARYVFDLEWRLADVALPEAELFHCGSIAAYLAPGAARVDALLAEAVARGAFTSFDPNIRPAFVPDVEAAWTRTRAVAGHCDLVKLSDEDAAHLAPGAADPADHVARALRTGRTRIVVVTEGGRGCLVASPDGVRRIPPGPPVEIADTVGAGDSFMAALLAQVAGRIARGEAPLPHDPAGVEALVAGADAAARITVTRPGADPPWRAEVADRIRL